MLKLTVIILEQYCVIYFGFLHIYQRNYLQIVWNCCDEFKQVNGGCLMSYVFNSMGESIGNQKHVYWICD